MLRMAVGLLAAASLCAAGREIVVVDTDSCLFCDDGAALTMLLRSPEKVAVAGITLVPGNTWPAQGAEYTGHILELLHRPQMAVYSGAQTPLVHSAAMAKEWERRWGALEYTGAFAQNPADVQAGAGRAAGGTESARRRRGGIPHRGNRAASRAKSRFWRIGPMTNIALALRLKPEIETKIKRIVFMGGNLRVAGNASPSAEFNFWFDPEAARIVLRSRIPQKVMFGLDICNTAPIRKARVRPDRGGAALRSRDLYREDLGSRYPGFLCAPERDGVPVGFAGGGVFAGPGFVTRSDLEYLDVLSAWGRFYGATIPLDRRIAPDATPVRVMQQLDYGRVWSLFKRKLTE